MGFQLAADLLYQNLESKLKVLDLKPIASRLMHPEVGLGWSEKEVEFAIARYKMFLYLMHFYPKQTIIPTREMDLVWHFHILDTGKYAADCQMLFGYFLHHLPSSGIQSQENKIRLERGFSMTLKLLNKHFDVSISSEVASNQSIFIINLKEELQEPSACPDTIEIRTSNISIFSS